MPNNKKSKQEKVDQIHQEIVAYLDGELNEEGARKVEQRLAQYPEYRRRVQQLEAAWECLGVLPVAEVDESFTQSTVEMAAVAAEAEIRQVESSVLRRSRTSWLYGAGIALVAASAGFLLMAYLGPTTNDDLLRDLPVIENVDNYLHADNIEFLRRLHTESIFDEEETGYAAG